jgi:plasmid stability protein
VSTLVIKNLPESLHADLKRQAKRNHRSVTKEVVSLIEAGITPPAKDPTSYIGAFPRYRSMEEVVAYVRELRQDRDET